MAVVFDVMLVGVLAALLVPALTRGSYSRLTEGWRVFPLLAAGFAIQTALDVFAIPEERWHDLGFGALVASYVLVLGFCAGNLLKRGMSIVLIGVACNALAIILNQGMPVAVPDDWARDGGIETTVKHHPQEPGDRLTALGDMIVLRAPTETVLSFGDLIMLAGLIDVSFHASRRPRSRRRRSTGPVRRPAPATHHGVRVTSPEEPETPPADVEAITPPQPAQPVRPAIDLSAYDLPTRRGDRELALAVLRHPANGLRADPSGVGRRALQENPL
ncbi:MAG: DUF5317 domain-containing protein [Acidimicrobiia bacterium]|nr:DUF5317 domain-containing protein [Acidimicrobiia bacterium]